MRILRDLKPAAFAVAPWTAALLTMAAGAMLLASGAMPSEPFRFVKLLEITPVFLIELSHFLDSVLGLALVLVAFGLRARLDAAWATTMLLLLVAASLSLLKGLNWEETVLLVLLAALLAPFRGAFPRTARLSRMEITPGWLVSALAAVAGAGLLGLWSFENADYGEMPWWRVMADADAARSVRAWAGAAIALLAFGFWRLIASAAKPPVVGEADPEFHRVREILASAEVAEPGSNLALLGDKRFLFSASGASFLMFGVRSRSWIALGGPVGRQDERSELVWRFRELADSHAARPGFYGLTAEDLPEIVELGFSIQKVGEYALVPLETFSVEGRKRGNLRRAWRKAGEDGCTFKVLRGDEVRDLLPALRAISDEWLSRHAGGEKSFSMGGFAEAYVAEFPVGVVFLHGQPVAFATLWTTARKSSFSMDLMRYGEAAPRNVMDYLFVELIEWGRSEGYDAFDFGMAPLAGLDDRPLAPIMSRVGRLLFERGEEIYNFQGVRKYKDKYDPLWQPRYVAAQHRWIIPLVLAGVGLLSSGGIANLAKRPKKEAPANPPEPALASDVSVPS
ncbi:bifunctional lysylphosphatidylglycerol flippase/synthetase MprF [Phenylobacterium sp. J367]|uniref:bifunctional lysylphosphatidylglycerol flippase/synthetase MprF n=1 Tax=Phenylobacterium sp. J367 TaxID=2898435 RepID=UPI002150BE97|nr:bifunctional lysylphosphatidylglycerol flippase/synthetase MprF [Phenylobacterium sp. J367]MCR5878754.1 bifunctional lysylphosphatidylglycerol flippase/synthetase MprF [Phenylobacterium sp. J367]